MAYAMLTPYGKAGRSLSAAAALLRGFNSLYPLTETERQHLVLLIACRLSCSVTLGAYSYQRNPENKYLLLHAEPAWKALELLWGKDKAKVRGPIDALFELACQENSSENQRVDDLQISDMYLYETTRRVKEESKRVEATAAGERVITFVTGNKKKLEEVQRILGAEALGFTITNAKIDLPELQGDPLEIAKEKCAEAAKQVAGAVITEDTSLCFTALHELPGPYIKWFLDKCGHDGLNNIVAYCEGPGKPVLTFDGRTMGKVVPPRGKLDFGWDPVFEPDEGNGKTYAEMSKDKKDSISHRSRAFSKFKAFLEEKGA
jgi:inosine triphosphate pyrophosphatase